MADDIGTTDTVSAGIADMRARAASMMMQAATLANDSDRLSVCADLLTEGDTLEAARQAARQAVTAAEAALMPELVILARLETDTAEASRRAKAAQEAADSGETDLTTAIEGEVIAIAAARTAVKLGERAAEKRREVLPLQQELASARRDLEAADVAAGELVDALASPLDHPRAQGTQGYLVRQLSGRTIPALLAGDHSRPEYWAGRAFLIECILKVTKIGVEIESRAIAGRTAELESGPLLAGQDGKYHVLTGTDSAMALRGAKTYHQAHTPAAEFAPGIPGAAA